MAKLDMKTMMAALLAGSLAVGAGGTAFARGGDAGYDPAKFQQHFKDMKSFRDQRVENRKAMEAAMQAPTIDPAKIEQIRAAQMKIADDTSKRFTKAMVDAGNVLNASQRQAFFKSWGERFGKRG